MASLQSRIRNFSIIAHIDHGKSTLADRLLEKTGAIPKREMEDQILDSHPLERERGITIKAHPVRLIYKARDGGTYLLHLIDTPGHVDFSYEVSRSLAACEGALLVVDGTQGIEAQTLANYFLAVDNNLSIIPIINKIDLPSAEPDRIEKELKEHLLLEPTDILRISAKMGTGIEEVLEAIVKNIPPPKGDPEAPLRALIFDSHYNPYRGVVASIRVIDGKIFQNQKIKMMSTEKSFIVEEVGVFTPEMKPVSMLQAGEVGYVMANIKNIADTQVGDTITDFSNPAITPLPGYRKVTPMVYCGFYPIENTDYLALKDALEKLKLNDAALFFEPETSAALGFGFRCGFLGLLHMEIVQERLEREYNLTLLSTAPNVVYYVTTADGKKQIIDNPAKWPSGKIEKVEEPFVKASIFTPEEYVGGLMELCQNKRGVYKHLEYLSPGKVRLEYELPLAEIITDFYDQLKSKSRGYASIDYELAGYRESDLVKLEILIHEEVVDALSYIVHRSKAIYLGRSLVSKLREVIPRQLFEVPIQAALGSKVIARENVKAMRKNVLAKCYGGDVTRKRKLLEKQKEGKKRMKQLGKVEIPQEAFWAILKLEE
jgi:GTP-binding protein LepA